MALQHIYESRIELAASEITLLSFLDTKCTLFFKRMYLRAQGELEALLWICFTLRCKFLIFEGKNVFEIFSLKIVF